ncbi:ferric aerobactin receptor IutA [Pantoea stewartii]|uniref:Ferric aerobactin receptor n=1 Tax=Pantoea stewartii subsp. stewartii DC283 TaxID=660596 RepID=H3RJF2_PANSE|nr:ferric aerobactin receptor IutA [Pantoea stewartii]ARF48504.1 ligand-gated channel protein [Pantoea stewartii subsp. stewartii DC283]EHT98409.1 aerobactin siderophore receptor [Pantoea stewartii subsp. stewartii DC283]KAB0551688.1 ferric aerobactin receptor IutA [Pantoea stewartii subsp. stewartii]
MKTKNKNIWLLNPLLLAMMAPAVAQQTSENEMVVSASRTHRTVAEMAQTTWVIEGAELEQQVQGGKEFKDALAQLVPGLDVSSQGRTNYGMNMRGRAIVVLVDGVRLNSSRTDSRQLDSIDPFNIDHIEVISGSTSLYGGGSTGGLINIVTKKGQPGTQFEFETGTKTGFNSSKDHDERVAAALSGGTDRASGRLSVAYQKFGGWYDGKGDSLLMDNTQTGLQYSDRLDIMGTGTLEIDDHQQLQLVTQYYKSQGDDDYGLYLGRNFSAVTGGGTAYIRKGLNSDRLPGTERHLVSLQYSNTDFLGQELVGQVYYRDESLAFYPFPTVSGGRVTSLSSSEQNTDQYGGKLAITSKPVDGLQLTYGVDADHELFSSNQMFFDLGQSAASGGLNNQSIYTTGRYPGYDITNLATFLQSSYDINETFTLSGGVRYQYTENKVDDFVGYAQQQAIANGTARSADPIPGGSTDYDNFLYNAGILMHITARQQAWFNFSQGVELPDPGKYYGRGTYGRAVNGNLPLTNSVNVDASKLQGIKVDSWELGWRYTGDNLRTQLSAYYSLSDKNVQQNQDLTISVVDDKRRIYGVEGAVDYFIPDTDWSTGANFNVLKTESKVDGSWRKYDVKVASPSKATAYVGWSPDPWSLKVQSTTSFNLSDDAGYNINGYTTVDFIGSYELPVGKLSFSVENLLDRDYTTVWGQRAPLYYSPTYGSPSLYQYKGRGRTFGLNYSVLF